MNIVQENMEGFTRHEIKGAKEGKSGLAKVGYPSEVYYKNIIRFNMIINFPVTPDYINNAQNIFGRDVSILKGKAVRKQPPPVVSNYIAIPE